VTGKIKCGTLATVATGEVEIAIRPVSELVNVPGIDLQRCRPALNKTETAAERALRDEVKALLGKAVASGNQLVREMKDKEDAQAVGDAEAWGQRTRDLVVAAYGEGEGDLFIYSVGVAGFEPATPSSERGQLLGSP
jgi:hypothetical protein